MDRLELQKLRDLPIEGVAERLGIQVTRHKCLCPFHEDHHPSMSFSMSRNTYRCFVCGAHGGTIDLVMEQQRLGFKEAVEWLSNGSIVQEFKGSRNRPSDISHQTSFDASRYERFFERPWLNDEAKRFLFDERRLDPRVVRWCRLTSWKDKQGVPWLQIPYYDREGKLVGIQNRNLAIGLKVQGVQGGVRFRFPSGSQCGIYNLPVLNLLKPGEELWITEGCSDCWAMLSAGHKAIAIPSATLLTQDVRSKMADVRCNGTSFHMFPDNDVPGERLFLQLKDVLPNLVRHQLPPGCKDFSDYYLTLKD